MKDTENLNQGICDRRTIVGERNTRRKFVVAILSLLATYAFFMPLNDAIYDILLFPFPDPITDDLSAQLKAVKDSGVSVSEAYFKSANGNVLHGIYFKLPNSKRTFLFSHGRGNNIFTQVEKARQYLSCGGSFFMYDYQGFGRSQGRPSVTKSCQDALAAYDYLVNTEKVPKEHIIAVGESFGSGVSTWLSERRQLAALVVHSGFTSLRQAGRDHIFWLRMYPDWLFPREMLDNEAILKKAHPPLLIVHGKADQTISCQHADQLFQSSIAPKDILLLPGGHCTCGTGTEFVDTLKKFISSNRL